MGEMPNLPTNSQHIALIGRNGSGKTLAGLWHLSLRDLDRFPWVVFNFKNDEHIDAIERAEHVDVNFRLPKKAHGIYVVHPMPKGDEQKIESLLWHLWQRERNGVFIDEGYLLPQNSDAFAAILTQGRSKRVPTIMCFQRPVWMNRFVVSESRYKQIFDMEDERDFDTAQSFCRLPLDQNLPEFYSNYYDGIKRKMFRFQPVPERDTLLRRIDEKLSPPPKRWL